MSGEEGSLRRPFRPRISTRCLMLVPQRSSLFGTRSVGRPGSDLPSCRKDGTMKNLLFIGGAIAVGSGLGYAAWRYNNRLVPEAVERAVKTDDWTEAQWLAGHQMMVGQIGKALIVPAVIVFGV